MGCSQAGRFLWGCLPPLPISLRSLTEARLVWSSGEGLGLPRPGFSEAKSSSSFMKGCGIPSHGMEFDPSPGGSNSRVTIREAEGGSRRHLRMGRYGLLSGKGRSALLDALIIESRANQWDREGYGGGQGTLLMASVTTKKMGSRLALKGKPELPYLVSRVGKPVSVFRLHTKEFTCSIGRAGFCRLQAVQQVSTCLGSRRVLTIWPG